MLANEDSMAREHVDASIYKMRDPREGLSTRNLNTNWELLATR